MNMTTLSPRCEPTPQTPENTKDEKRAKPERGSRTQATKTRKHGLLAFNFPFSLSIFTNEIYAVDLKPLESTLKFGKNRSARSRSVGTLYVPTITTRKLMGFRPETA